MSRAVLKAVYAQAAARWGVKDADCRHNHAERKGNSDPGADQNGELRERLLDLLRFLGAGDCDFPLYVIWWESQKLQESEKTRQNKNLFPLPPLSVWQPPAMVDMLTDDTVRLYTNLTLAALNFLNCDLKLSKKQREKIGFPNASQRATIEHVCQRVQRRLQRLRSLENMGHNERAFEKFEEPDSAQYVATDGDKVDFPKRAATCDPSKLMPPEAWVSVSNADNVFPNPIPCPMFATAESAQERFSYARLSYLELACGKIGLAVKVKGCARVFDVPKPGMDTHRLVWNGSFLSNCAREPPPPPRLANPAVFLELVSVPGQPFWMSKRDASTYFDLLLAPESSQKWFGRPWLPISEIMIAGGVDIEFVKSFLVYGADSEIRANTEVYPFSRVFPMGFSWSSFVAQSRALTICNRAGIDLDQILSLDLRLSKMRLPRWGLMIPFSFIAIKVLDRTD